MQLEKFILLRKANEKLVKTFCAGLFSNNQFLNRMKILAFFWRWQAMDNCVLNKM